MNFARDYRFWLIRVRLINRDFASEFPVSAVVAKVEQKGKPSKVLSDIEAPIKSVTRKLI